MRVIFFVMLAGFAVGVGCTASKPETARLPVGAVNASGPDANAKFTRATGGGVNVSESPMIVTPHPVLVGRVVSFNMAARFVVLNFPVGHLPTLEQQLDIFRHGIKVGEVKVTGPQRDDNIVADVTAGEAQPGDEARAR